MYIYDVCSTSTWLQETLTSDKQPGIHSVNPQSKSASKKKLPCSGRASAHAKSRPSQGSNDIPRPSEPNPTCPRCQSTSTKFCYYNNYNVTQPRYYCQVCYWAASNFSSMSRWGNCPPFIWVHLTIIGSNLAIIAIYSRLSRAGPRSFWLLLLGSHALPLRGCCSASIQTLIPGFFACNCRFLSLRLLYKKTSMGVHPLCIWRQAAFEQNDLRSSRFSAQPSSQQIRAKNCLGHLSMWPRTRQFPVLIYVST